MAMPGFFVDAPAVREYDHGLVASATRKSINGEGSNEIAPGEQIPWLSGVSFYSSTHLIVNGLCVVCDSDPTKSAEQTCTADRAFYPYLLEVGVYERVGSRFPNEIYADAARMLTVGTSAKLENLTITGCTGMDTNPVLPDGTSITGGTATQIVGRMAAYFYNAGLHIGAQGTIYMSPVDFVNLGFDLVREDSNGILRTKFGGHKVIVGNYPAGTIYGHLGDVDLYLTDVWTPDAPDSIRRDNVARARIERYALVVWDSAHTVKATVS